MTTYTAIANGSVDAGSPIDEALVTALRDNPLAIQEGDATAPAIADIALEPNQGTPAAGDVAIASGTQYFTESDNGNVLAFTVNIAGTYRVRARAAMYSGSGVATISIKRDATTLQTSSNITGVNSVNTDTSTAFAAGETIYISINDSSGTYDGIVTASVGCDSVGFIVDRVSAGMLI